MLLGTPRVAVAPVANFDPAYRVTIDVQRFESARNVAMQNGSVLIEAVCVVRKAAGGNARSGHTVAREPAPSDGFDVLAKVSGDIAAAIRAEADGKP